MGPAGDPSSCFAGTLLLGLLVPEGGAVLDRIQAGWLFQPAHHSLLFARTGGFLDMA